MFKLKNIFILFVFFITPINYCLEPLDNEERKKDSASSLSQTNNMDLSSDNIETMFTFISLDNKKIIAPLEIAMQCEIVKSRISFYQKYSNQSNFELKVGMNANILKTLLNALCVINKVKYLENKKEFYELIQNQVLEKVEYNSDIQQSKEEVSIQECFSLLIASNYLRNELLINVFADKLVQLLINNEDQSLNQEKLNELVNLIIKSPYLIAFWYLIEKFYYLRITEMIPYIYTNEIYNSQYAPKITNLLLNNFPQVVNIQGNIDKVELIKQWQLSINDLVDYGKPLRVECNTFNLPNFFLSSIDGLQRIPNIKDIYLIGLENNQLSELGNNLHGLTKLNEIYLSGNSIVNLGKSFEGLPIKELYMDSNKINNLKDHAEFLLQLIEFDFGENPLSEESKVLIKNQ